MTRQHGGLAEILRSRQAPGVRVGGRAWSDVRDFRIPGVAPADPRKGWQSAKHLDKALKAAKMEAGHDSEFLQNYNRSLHGPIVNADRRTDGDPGKPKEKG